MKNDKSKGRCKKSERYVIEGGGCKVVVKGNRILDATGSVVGVMKIIARWDPLTSSDIPKKVIYELKKAYKEIQILRKMYLPGWGTPAQRCNLLKNYLNANQKDFSYVEPAFINQDWFDASHGPRNAISRVLPDAARKNGVIIKPSHAEKIITAINKKQKIPSVPTAIKF